MISPALARARSLRRDIGRASCGPPCGRSSALLRLRLLRASNSTGLVVFSMHLQVICSNGWNLAVVRRSVRRYRTHRPAGPTSGAAGLSRWREPTSETWGEDEATHTSKSQARGEVSCRKSDVGWRDDAIAAGMVLGAKSKSANCKLQLDIWLGSKLAQTLSECVRQKER